MYHVDYVAYHGAFFFNGQMVTRIQAHDIGIGALTTLSFFHWFYWKVYGIAIVGRAIFVRLEPHKELVLTQILYGSISYVFESFVRFLTCLKIG